MLKINWGVIGTGWIANMFANTMKAVDESEIIGVSDISADLAKAYQKEHSVKQVFSSVEEMLNCQEINAIYIATPHCFHTEYMKLALYNNKHVLCVKPVSLNAADFKEVIEIAKERKLLLMEAMWTRFKPEFLAAREKVRSGTIGKLEQIQASCMFHPQYNPESRLFNKKLGGGSLLDVGIYVLSLTSFFMEKQPVCIKAVSDIGQTGVDLTTSALFKYADGSIATLSSSFVTDMRHDIVLFGTEGRITINGFWYSDSYELEIYGKEKEVFSFPIAKSTQIEKHDFMIEAFNNCIRNGLTDNNVIPLEETYQIMKTVDEILDQIGIKY
jgi:dihydrodiol dehydrogenase / D-xylose 1-dehydrogenase (NADP)